MTVYSFEYGLAAALRPRRPNKLWFTSRLALLLRLLGGLHLCHRTVSYYVDMGH